jgi:hypothetical protein
VRSKASAPSVSVAPRAVADHGYGGSVPLMLPQGGLMSVVGDMW